MNQYFLKIKIDLLFLLNFLVIGIIFNSCSVPEEKSSKDNGGGGGGGKPSSFNIYIAGSYNNGTKFKPCYWKDNTRIDLKDSAIFSTHACSIDVFAGTVYTCGYIYDATSILACYWQGTKYFGMLEDPSIANSIYVSKGIVYTCGFYDFLEEPLIRVPCYVKGVFPPYDLMTSIPGLMGEALSIYVSHDDTIYTCGYYINGQKAIACYWISIGTTDTKTDLTDGKNDAHANSIYVLIDTNIIITCGYYSDGSKNIPCFWINTNRYDLPSDGTHNAEAKSVFVSGGIIYNCGIYNDGTKDKPCYWMSPLSSASTTRIDLPCDGIHSAYANSIYISGSAVYTCGSYSDGIKNIPCYWIGTTKKDLKGDGIHDAYAKSILIYDNNSVELF